MGKTMWIVIIFLVVGSYMIVKNSQLNLEEKQDQKTFLKQFGKWTLGIGKNVKDVAGYAIKNYEWLPKNETNNTEVNK